MKQLVDKVVLAAVALSLLITTACGTLIYPERRGQAKGDIDTTVVIMDGVLLLFGLVPGLVAFAVDFHTNAIYLPEGADVSELPDDLSGMRVVHVDEELTESKIEAVLREETGKDVDITLAQWYEMD